jgi:hypothetical protein
VGNAQPVGKLLPFQGRLTDQNGNAVSNGVRLVQFKIYDVPTGGSPVWAGELHRTTVNGGLVNVMLGSKTPMASIDFDKELYLEITVDVSGPSGEPDNAITPADPPMLPRQSILPVIFAKESGVSKDSKALAGYDWSVLFGTNDPLNGVLSGSRILSNSITGAQLASGAITSINLANGVITPDKLSPRPFGINVPIGGVAVSQDLTAYYPFTNTISLIASNSIISIATRGRPVRLQLVCTFDGIGISAIQAGRLSITNIAGFLPATNMVSGNVSVILTRGFAGMGMNVPGTAIGQPFTLSGFEWTSMNPSQFAFLDFPPAQTNTYVLTFQCYGFPTTSPLQPVDLFLGVQGFRLIAEEL